MKRKYITLTLAFTFFLFTSMAWVRLSLLKPALLVLPEHIRTIALIDRTLEDETSRTRLERVVTGEVLKQDEQALRQAIEGMIGVCTDFNLFNLVRTTERYKGGGTKTTFPPVLSWSEVKQHCQKHQADALLAVEIFDTDFLLTNPGGIARQVAEGKVSGGGGVQITGVAVINFGVRLYDPVSQRVIDEYNISHRMNYSGGGDPVNQVLDKVNTMNRASREAGEAYGKRISPSYYSVVREFYNKPKKDRNLIAGVRKSQVADWRGAIESWEKALLSRKNKVARRAAFNIAVGYEVLGDLEKAREWAAKSFTEYGEKRGNTYHRQLQARIREEAEIRRQVP